MYRPAPRCSCGTFGVGSEAMLSWSDFLDAVPKVELHCHIAGAMRAGTLHEIAAANGVTLHVGNVLSADNFYDDGSDGPDQWKKMGVLAVEMEAAGLYMNAARAGKRALGLFTISDHIYRAEELTSEQRQNSFVQMITIALDTAVNMANL